MDLMEDENDEDLTFLTFVKCCRIQINNAKTLDLFYYLHILV